jgi:hypothetical protein
MPKVPLYHHPQHTQSSSKPSAQHMAAHLYPLQPPTLAHPSASKLRHPSPSPRQPQLRHSRETWRTRGHMEGIFLTLHKVCHDQQARRDPFVEFACPRHITTLLDSSSRRRAHTPLFARRIRRLSERYDTWNHLPLRASDRSPSSMLSHIP